MGPNKVPHGTEFVRWLGGGWVGGCVGGWGAETREFVFRVSILPSLLPSFLPSSHAHERVRWFVEPLTSPGLARALDLPVQMQLIRDAPN